MGCLAGSIVESKGNHSCKPWRLECAAHLFAPAQIPPYCTGLTCLRTKADHALAMVSKISVAKGGMGCLAGALWGLNGTYPASRGIRNALRNLE
jgi:hypothetical protein